MNKKAMSSVIYGIIIGFVLFFIVAFAFGSAIKGALKGEGDLKIAEILATTIDEVGDVSSGTSLKLVALQLDEDMGIYIFPKDEIAIVETYYESIETASVPSKEFILRPDECELSKNCVCTCNQISYRGASEIKTVEINNHYGSSATIDSKTLNLVCKSITCQAFTSNFVQTTQLEQIINPQSYERIKEQEIISKWEDGFSFWRISDSKRNHFYASSYIDVYAVKLTDGTVALCFDPDCQSKIE